MRLISAKALIHSAASKLRFSFARLRMVSEVEPLARGASNGLILFVCVLIFVFASSGCETVARKFVRKPKTEDKKTEDVVFAPQEYKSGSFSKEELYRQYFLYWRTWQDELINSLESPESRKKQMLSLNEAVKNLENIKGLVNPENAAKLDSFIARLRLLRAAIAKDIYSQNSAHNRRQAELIKRGILRDFAFNKIKDNII